MQAIKYIWRVLITVGRFHRALDYFTRIANTSPFSHLWFLSIEMQFYLIFPLIIIWII